MQTKIHINQHNIRANSKGGNLPVITVKDYKRNRRANGAEIIHEGEVIARVVYSPDEPLSCGAKVWIETELEVRVSDDLLWEETTILEDDGEYEGFTIRKVSDDSEG
jgi:hypothetical protein